MYAPESGCMTGGIRGASRGLLHKYERIGETTRPTMKDLGNIVRDLGPIMRYLGKSASPRRAYENASIATYEEPGPLKERQKAGAHA